MIVCLTPLFARALLLAKLDCRMLVMLVAFVVKLLRMCRTLVARLLLSNTRTTGAVSPHYVVLVASASLMANCNSDP